MDGTVAAWRDLFNSIDGLATVISFGNWGLGVSAFFTALFTIVAIVANTKQSRLQRKEDLARGTQIAEAIQKAGDANQRAEELRRRNLELEQSLAPRRLPIIVNHGKSNFDPLKHLAI